MNRYLNIVNKSSLPSRNVRSGHYHVRHFGYKKVSGYTSRKGNPRVGQAVIYLHSKYSIGMHDIARILNVSTRTVHKKISFWRAVTKKSFDLSHRRRRHEVKIVNTKGRVISFKKLKSLCQSFIHGIFSSIRDALGDEPP